MVNPLFKGFLVFLSAFLLPILFVWGTFPFWKWLSFRIGLVDNPGQRKIHKETTSLAGGITIFSGVILCILLDKILFHIDSPTIFWWAGGLCAIFLLGFIDDLHELPPLPKFLAQLLIISVICTQFHFQIFESSLLNILCSILWVGVIMNTLNFLDNMNGLCCGLGFILLCSLTITTCILVFILMDDSDELIPEIPACLTFFMIMGGLLGFLPYNYPKAKAFLGDSGSHLIGYTVGTLSLLVASNLFRTLPDLMRFPQRLFVAFLPVLCILSIPLYDLCSVMIIRLRNHKPIYVGDTNHTSHRLVRRGYSPAVAVAIIWGATALTSIVGIIITFLLDG